MNKEEFMKKLATIPEEKPDKLDLELMNSPPDDGESIILDEYVAMRKNRGISLRIPCSLKKQLAEKAHDEGVSLNQYCMYLLTTGVAEGH